MAEAILSSLNPNPSLRLTAPLQNLAGYPERLASLSPTYASFAFAKATSGSTGFVGVVTV